ncbi:hypothetical protein D1872_348200 [compost metagenome]
MVPGQPGFGKVAERQVFVNFFWIEVAVVINNRHIGGVLVIQRLGHIGGQQKIIV